MKDLQLLVGYLHELRKVLDDPEIVTVSILCQYFMIEMGKEKDKEVADKYFNIFKSLSELKPNNHVLAFVYNEICTYMFSTFNIKTFNIKHKFGINLLRLTGDVVISD